jgi:hypothetical protein
MSETLLGRYRIEASLGRGGAAEVFRARDLELDRAVAVKVLTGDGPLADAARLREEAQVLARLAHPNILEILAIEEADGRLFLVLELVGGGSLATRLASHGPYPEAEARARMAEVLGALAAAHGAGVIHRDVKPENVLIHEGRAKLSDFGLAKHAESKVRTATGMLLGTPEYMAPEVFQGEAAGPPADVYAAACLAYRMLTGCPTYAGEVAEIVRAKVRGPPRLDAVPSGWRPGLARMLDSDPARRPSAGKAAVTLGSSTPPPEDLERRLAPTVEVPRRPRARRRTFPWALVASPLLLVVAVAWWWARTPEPVDPGPGAPVPDIAVARTSSEARASAMVESWEGLFEGRAWDDLLRSACRNVVGRCRVGPLDTEAYVQTLWKRRDKLMPSPEAIGMELELVRDLGVDEHWNRDRVLLQSLLGDRAVAPVTRQRLAEALYPLVHADALMRAAKVGPHFHAAEVLAAHGPRFLEDWPAPASAAPELAAGTELQLGETRGVFSWETEGDRRFPRIDPREAEPSVAEAAILAGHTDETGGEFRADRHEGVYRRVRLSPAAAGATWLDVDMRVSNFFATNVLHLRVNRFRTIVNGSPELDPSGHWRFKDPTWWRVRVRVPGDYLRPGDNVLEVTAEPIPGLGRWAGYWLERIEVAAARG